MSRFRLALLLAAGIGCAHAQPAPQPGAGGPIVPPGAGGGGGGGVTIPPASPPQVLLSPTTAGGAPTLGGALVPSSTTTGTGSGTLATLADINLQVPLSAYGSNIGTLLYGNGAGLVSALTPGTSGLCLQTNGSGAAPSWGSCGSGGTPTGTVTGLSYNSTGAASANTAAINTALAAGGYVNVICPATSPTLYLNASLVLHTHTSLNFGNCAPTLATNTNAPALVNYEYTQPWTYINQGTSDIVYSASLTFGSQATNGLGATLYYPNHGLSVGSWVQVGPMPDNPAWAVSTTYDVGVHVINGGNIYTVTTAGTSASSGTGPSGTGTSITDGTVVWTYTNTYSGNVGYFWSGTGTAGAQGGVEDTAYAGVFYVASVPDANHVIILLRRAPAVAFSGIPIMVRPADHDIQVNGGQSIINCNGANQSGTTTAQKTCILMVGIARSKFENFAQQNVKKWAFGIEGGAQVTLDYIDGSPEVSYVGANQNQFMTYGCFDCIVSHTRGWGFDDTIAIQTSNDEVTQHADELFMSGQDVLNFTASHIETVGGYGSLSIWNLHNTFYMDNITLDHGFSHSNSASNVGSVRLNNAGYATTATAGTASIGSIKIVDSGARDTTGPFLTMSGSYGSMSIDSLTLDNVQTGPNAAVGQLVNLNPASGYSISIKSLSVLHSKATLSPSAADSFVSAGCTGCGTVSIGKLTLDSNAVTGSTAYGDYLFSSSSANDATVNSATLTNNWLSNVTGFRGYVGAGSSVIFSNNYIAAATVVGDYGVVDPVGLNIVIANNYEPSGIGTLVDAVHNTTAYFTGNYTPNSIAVVFNASVAAVVTSGGGNTVSSWFANTGTETVYGWDIKCDVTKLTRTTGEYCFNTNAAPGSGTLNTSGLVIDQGTSANSWALLYNPTGQQY